MKHKWINAAGAALVLILFTAYSPLAGQAAEPAKPEPVKVEILKKWKLAPVFKDWTAWENAGQAAEANLQALAALKGKLASSPDVLLKALQIREEVSAAYYRLHQYLRLHQDSGAKIDKNVMNQRWRLVVMLRNNVANHTAWVLPETREIPYKTIMDWLKKKKELAAFGFLLNDLNRRKAYTPDEKKQEVLRALGRFFNTPASIYDKLTGPDFRPLTISLNSGKEMQVTAANFHALVAAAVPGSEQVLESAFKAFYKSHRATLASFIEIFNSVCHLEAGMARVRGFNSAFRASLHPWNVSPRVYENLLKMSRAGAAPMRRYIDFRKGFLKLKEHHVFNLPVPLFKADRAYDYKTAANWIQNAVKPLGKAYVKRMKQAFNDGWLQVRKKSGGGMVSYTGSIYGVHSYALIEDNGSPDFAFHLSKQMGHLLHLDFAARGQRFSYASPLALVQDTVTYLNDRLLLDHLLTAVKDPKTRAVFLDNFIRRMIGGYYMPAMQAELELQAHSTVMRGTPLNEEILKKLSQEQFKGFFKDSMTYDDFLDIYWVQRRSIYTAPFTAYQDSAALAAATKLYHGLTNGTPKEKQQAAERIIALLKAGSNGYPVDLLKEAGADLTDPATFLAVGRDMDDLITRLEIEVKNVK